MILNLSTRNYIPHKHPSLTKHMLMFTACDYSMNDKYDDTFNSSSAEESFQHAMLIATLAERFNLTSFTHFQKNIITASIEGTVSLVVQKQVVVKFSFIFFHLFI